MIHPFHLKLLCQRPVLEEIEWWPQNEPITTTGVLPVTASFFGKFISVLELLKKSSFDVPTTLMPVFVFFVALEFNFTVIFFPCEYP